MLDVMHTNLTSNNSYKVNYTQVTENKQMFTVKTAVNMREKMDLSVGSQ